jgi:hypothetical protein
VIQKSGAVKTVVTGPKGYGAVGVAGRDGEVDVILAAKRYGSLPC